jgi:hypothetical protein
VICDSVRSSVLFPTSQCRSVMETCT